ncbi:hypothetical protein HDU84_006922 [Entophlyctis sp. JEL0112]|nr:hypothetical protein HDU84_006922 [Entophlyctis sp. JEL0112]
MSATKKIALVVGGTNGIGKGIAANLARRGVSVTIAARNQIKAQNVARDIDAAGFLLVDVTDQASIAAFAEQVLREYDHIDYLVLSAGYLSKIRTLTNDGVELHLAVNYLWRFQLVRLLVGVLSASPNPAGARVLNVAGTGTNAPVFFEDPNFEREKWTMTKAAWQAQILNDVFTVEAHRRWSGLGNGIQFHVVFPGMVKTGGSVDLDFATKVVWGMMDPFKKSIDQSASELVPLLVDEIGMKGGKLWKAGYVTLGLTEFVLDPKLYNAEYNDKCWALSESLVK